MEYHGRLYDVTLSNDFSTFTTRAGDDWLRSFSLSLGGNIDQVSKLRGL
jgi:hypothetical protein